MTAGKSRLHQNEQPEPAEAREDLNQSIMTVSSRYRHKNQNSIYYLKPRSNDIFFLDFRQQGFCGEKLKWN